MGKKRRFTQNTDLLRTEYLVDGSMGLFTPRPKESILKKKKLKRGKKRK